MFFIAFQFELNFILIYFSIHRPFTGNIEHFCSINFHTIVLIHCVHLYSCAPCYLQFAWFTSSLFSRVSYNDQLFATLNNLEPTGYWRKKIISRPTTGKIQDVLIFSTHFYGKGPSAKAHVQFITLT